MTSTATARKPSKAERREANRQAAADARKAAAKNLKHLRDTAELDLDEDEKLADAFADLTTHYSEGNATLILLQAAALGLRVRGLRDVGGYNAFKERGRKVKDAEKSNRKIYIWYKITNPATEADLEETSTDGKRSRFAVIGIYHRSQTEPMTVDTPDDIGQAEAVAAVDADRTPGETRRAYAARTYTAFVDAQYVAAERATRGHLLSADAQAAGTVEARDLFRGRADVAMRHASPELIEWWESNPRRTLAAHTAAIMGGTA